MEKESCVFYFFNNDIKIPKKKAIHKMILNNFYINYNLPKSCVHNLIKEKIFVYNNWILKNN